MSSSMLSHQQTLMLEAFMAETRVIKPPQQLVHIRHNITKRQYSLWMYSCITLKNMFDKDFIDLEKTPLSSLEWISFSRTTLNTIFGYEYGTNHLKEDFENLRLAPLIFNILQKDKKNVLHSAGFISESKISDGTVEVKLPSKIVECIATGNTSLFSQINFSVLNNCKSKYEQIIYKLCCDFVGVGRTREFTCDEYRFYIHLEDNEYTAPSDFTRHTLTIPIKRLNENPMCDITVELKERRVSKKLISFYFKVNQRKGVLSPLSDDFFNSPYCLITKDIRDAASLLSHSDALNTMQSATDYISSKKQKGEDVSPVAVYRHAFKNNWGKDRQESKIAKEVKKREKMDLKASQEVSEKKETIKKLKKEFIRIKTLEIHQGFSAEQMLQKAREFYSETYGGVLDDTLFDLNSRKFKTTAVMVSFRGWLASNYKYAFVQEDFDAWLEKSGHV